MRCRRLRLKARGVEGWRTGIIGTGDRKRGNKPTIHSKGDWELLFDRLFTVIGADLYLAEEARLSVWLASGLEARPRPVPLINGERLANAMARYTKDLHSRGEALPRTITLDTLDEPLLMPEKDAEKWKPIDLEHLGRPHWF
jgi:hypothetical protein